MSRFIGFVYSLRSLLRRSTADSETAEEIADYIDRQTRKHVTAGLEPTAARALALQEFGGTDRWREETADARAGHVLDEISQDARYAIRVLRRHRAFTAIAILTLGVGIGGTTAATAIVQHILFAPLPYTAPERLVALQQANDRSNAFPFSAPNLVDFSAEAKSYVGIGAGMPTQFSVGSAETVTRVFGALVVGEFFETLQVTPHLGRYLTIDDAGQGPVVVLGYDLWQREYGGDSTIIGRRIALNTFRATVVGVMPPHFEQPAGANLWMICQWCVKPPPATRSTIGLEVVARLAPGVTLAQAEAEANQVGKRIHDAHPNPSENQMQTIHVRSLHEATVGDARERIWLIGVAVSFVLLIGCANLASANLARNTARLHELSLRSALGAGRGRIVRQLVVESLVLAVGGSVLGLLVAWWTVRIVARYGAERLPRLSELALGPEFIVVALLIAVFVTLVIGAMPALQLSMSDLRTRIGAQRTTIDVGGARLRGLLIGAEIALSLVLVVGAGLTVRSLQLVERQPIGVDTKGLVMIEPELSYRKYGANNGTLRFREELERRVVAIPGIRAASLASTEPLGLAWTGFVHIEGFSESAHTTAQYNLVDETFFKTMGISLVRGRVFTTADDSSTDHVTVIDQTMANRFWPGVDAIGKRFKALSIGDHNDRWLTVIGIVGNVRSFALENELSPTHYVSARQRPGVAGATKIIVRSDDAAAAVIPELRRVIREMDPEVRAKITTFGDRVSEVTAERRATTNALSSFAVIALLLSAIGVYGVLSYNVALRMREIGIRMALGADSARVVGDVIRQVLWPIAGGIVVGLAGTRIVSRIFESLVFGLTPTDPVVIAIGTLLLVLLAMLAAYVPARRATRADPLVALRTD